MTTARFTVVRAGPQISVQDSGRPGHLRSGVPASGPMDRFAFAIANLSLGNPQETPAIEVSLGGIHLLCTEGRIGISIAGGDFRVSIDDNRINPWSVTSVQAGQVLTILPGRWGNWCYLAFAGELKCNQWLGSASTHALSGLGGGIIRAGTDLIFNNAELRPRRHTSLACPVSARPRHVARVVLGPQDRFFSHDTITTFLTSPFAMSDAYDRMGVRLSGPPLHPVATLDMPSEPILRGSIQVAGDGVATVLLADHQTTGGYPKIATILSDDVDGLVQLRGRNALCFEAVTPQAAIAAARTRNKSRLAYLAKIAGDHQ